MDYAPSSLKRYLYAIVQSGDTLILDARNGYAVPLRNIPYQGIGAVVGDLIPGKGAVTPENVLRHERIVDVLQMSTVRRLTETIQQVSTRCGNSATYQQIPERR